MTYALISAAILLPKFNKLQERGHYVDDISSSPVTMFIIHKTIVTCIVTMQPYSTYVTMY